MIAVSCSLLRLFIAILLSRADKTSDKHNTSTVSHTAHTFIKFVSKINHEEK